MQSFGPPAFPSPSRIRDEILRRARAAGPDKSICPSEVARGLAEAWRPLMTPVRNAAIALVREGRLQILRHGKPVADLDTLRGVIRLRIADEEDGACETPPPPPP
jgi:hypothetical protein